MSFSQTAGTSVIPFLSRLVLAGAFVTAGWAKVSQSVEYSGAEAEVLRRMNVVDERDRVVDEPASAAATPDVVLASFQADTDAAPTARDKPPPPTPADADDDNDDDATAGPDDGAGSTDRAPADGDAATGDEELDLIVEPQGEGTYSAKKLYGIAIMLDRAGYGATFPSAVWLAWIAALTELVGGGLILVGLFSRVWGFALAATMAAAFYLTSWEAVLDARLLGLAIPDPFNQVYVQLALLVLATGVMLTGPGPLSIDRVLFRRERPLVEDV